MNTYQPYFYIIQDQISSRYYAGSRYGKNAHPSELLTEDGYHTSSTVVQNLISNNGLGSFKIIRIRIFDSGIDAHNYETKFLQKIDAANNHSFINGHNNDGMIIVDWNHETIENMLLTRRKTIDSLIEKDPNWQKRQIEQRKQTMMERYGVPNNGLLKTTQ